MGLGLLKAKVSDDITVVCITFVVQADALSKHLEAPLLQISTT